VAVAVAAKAVEERLIRSSSRTEPEPSVQLIELIRACQQGDREAFGKLFDAYRDRVFSLALHFTGDVGTASDVTQDVFLKLLTRIRQFREQAQFSTWLYRIVVNTCLDHRRSLRRLVSVEEPGEAGSLTVSALQEQGALRQEISRIVRRALLSLRPEIRLAVIMRYVSGLSYDEIAGVLGISPGTVASRLSRGHRRLARELAHLASVAPLVL